jgi:hypothetical protein
MCNSLQDDIKDKNIQLKSTICPINDILKRKNMRDMGLICTEKKKNNDTIGNIDCENRSTNNNMDYWFIFKKIISYSINEWVNLSLARIYWAINNDSSSVLANKYINNHYKTIWSVPELKNYPKTYQKLIQYINNAKKIQKESYFIDYNMIQKEKIEGRELPWIALFFLSTDEW